MTGIHAVLIELCEALPLGTFVEGGEIDMDEIDAAEFVDHAGDFVKAMGLASTALERYGSRRGGEPCQAMMEMYGSGCVRGHETSELPAAPTIERTEHGLSDLILALQIFRKYADPDCPTHCEHDQMDIMDVDPDVVSDKDKADLETLGFEVGNDQFYSFRFGSA